MADLMLYEVIWTVAGSDRVQTGITTNAKEAGDKYDALVVAGHQAELNLVEYQRVYTTPIAPKPEDGEDTQGPFTWRWLVDGWVKVYTLDSPILPRERAPRRGRGSKTSA